MRAQPLLYLTPRLIDVGIGVVTGLAVNVLVFPPLQLRPAEHAIRQWGNDVAAGLDDLADVAVGRTSPGSPGTHGPGSSGQCRGPMAWCSIP